MDDMSMPGSPGETASMRSTDDLSPRSMADEDGRHNRPGSSDNVQVCSPVLHNMLDMRIPQAHIAKPSRKPGIC